MLQLNLEEFVFRIIPESFIINYGVLLLSQEKKIGAMKYVISSIIVSIMVTFVRYLPISFGLHIFINIALTMFVMGILGLPLIKSIYNTFFMYFLISFSEFINILILEFFNINLNFSDTNIIKRLLLGIPSLFITIIIISIIKFILKKEKYESI